MKHPVRSDFHSVVNEAGVSVTFKPTNSIYCFYGVTDINDMARLGPSRSQASNTRDAILKITLPMKFKRWRNAARPFSLTSVRHTGPSGNPRRIASEVAATLWLIQNLDKPD
jgi:hypothetical protein